MAASILYEFVGRVLVYVGGSSTPETDDWDEHIRALREHVAAHPDSRSLVWAGGARLSAIQRKQLADVMPKKTRTSVITDSMIDRGIVTALTWFVDGIKAFSPSEEDEAVAHLDLRDEEIAPVMEAAARLRTQMAEPRREGVGPGSM